MAGATKEIAHGTWAGTGVAWVLKVFSNVSNLAESCLKFNAIFVERSSSDASRFGSAIKLCRWPMTDDVMISDAGGISMSVMQRDGNKSIMEG